MRTRTVGALVASLMLGAMAIGCSSTESGGSAASEAVSSDGASGGARDIAPAVPGAGQDAGTPGQAPTQPVDVGVQRQVVRTADLRIRVDDLAAAVTAARAIPARYSGFVSGENSGGETANLDLRIDQARLDTALDELSALGVVVSRNATAQDVTDQVVDLQARIASQQAGVDRLRVLLGQAGTIGEVVQVESELTSRQSELESLQQRSAALAGQAALATVQVWFVSESDPVVTDDRPDTGFLAGLGAGWGALGALVNAVATLAGALLPFAIALGVPVVVIVLVVRRRRRRSVPVTTT